MTTVVVLVGNTDNKLTQQEWHEFYTDVDVIVRDTGNVQFSGPSAGDAPWQNACWVCTVEDEWVNDMREQLRTAAARWRQESIALVLGETEFVEATE